MKLPITIDTFVLFVKIVTMTQQYIGKIIRKKPNFLWLHFVAVNRNKQPEKSNQSGVGGVATEASITDAFSVHPNFDLLTTSMTNKSCSQRSSSG